MLRFIQVFVLYQLLLVTTANAQQLRRRGTLGVVYEEASKELMTSLRVIETHGIVVKEVQANSTAETLGIRANDVLVGINRVDSLFLYDFLQESNKLYENDPISVNIVRDRYKIRLVGKVGAAPRETSSVGDVLYSEVPLGRGYLRAIVHKPTGAGPFPTVFFMQDYDCASIDFAYTPQHPTKQLIDGWVRAGYAVYRVEKPGIGESENTRDCSRTTFLEELRAFERAYAVLKKNNFVDSTHVYFFGQGVGASIAPLVASRAVGSKPRGIMAYGAVVKPWFEHMIDVFRKQPMLYKTSQQSIEANTRMLTPLLYDWLIAEKSPNELVENPDYEAILTSKENPLQYNKSTFFGKSPKYFSELNKQNLFQAWAQAGVSTLTLLGEFDTQSINDEAAKTIASVVNEVKPNKASFKLIKGTDRYFAKHNSMDEFIKTQELVSYKSDFVQKNFNVEIVEITTTWMKQR